MQDLILTKLADIGDLAVISRTSTMQYGSHPRNLRLIGQQLGVATLLEGSVQKAGNQVLINVQLIDTRNDHHIWAQSYQRTLYNIFGVEGEVAEKIAAALKTKLSPAEAKRPDLAVPLLARAVATPGIGNAYSPVLLWIDPAWDPIRHDPRFQALLKKIRQIQANRRRHRTGFDNHRQVGGAEQREARHQRPNDLPMPRWASRRSAPCGLIR